MAFLTRVSNYLWSYVSPQKTQKRRDKPYRSPAPATRTPSDIAARVQQWREKQKANSPEGESSMDSVELEGDTLIDASITERTPASNIFSTSDAELDANDTTLVMDEEEYAYECLESKQVFDAAAVQEYCERKAEEMRDLGWSESAIKLFLKLETRGREPLLPKTWELDFESLPEALFSSNDEEVFIKSASGGNFRASLSLRELNRVGPNVRDALQAQRLAPTTQRSPETVSKKAVNEYLKWAYADAGLKVVSGSSRKSLDSVLSASSTLPLVVVEAGSKNVDPNELQNNALQKVMALGEKWKHALFKPDSGDYIAPLPTLYAVVATFNLVGFAAYDIDASDEDGTPIEPFLRMITTFDFEHLGHDVWNSLNIALLAVHVRNEMCHLKDKIQASIDDREDGDAEVEVSI